MDASEPDGRDLKDYIGARLGQVNGLRREPRGLSRQTWVADYDSGDGQSRRVVIRRDLDGGSICPAPLLFEYEIYSRLARSAVPAPRPLWFEPEGPGGRSLYIREHVAGDWRVAAFLDPQGDPIERLKVAREHVRGLALAHSCDWEGLGFGDIMEAPRGPSLSAGVAIERILRLLEDFRLEPMPVVEEAVAWLHDHRPFPTQRVSLLKGNNGLGEEVFRDSRLVAMLDWELASLGDPASDFAHCQEFLSEIHSSSGERVWGLQEALDYYEGITDIHVEPETVGYYRTLVMLEVVMFAHHAAGPVVTGHDLLARLAWMASDGVHRANRLIARSIGLCS